MKYEYLYWNCEKLLEAYKTKQLSPVEVVKETLNNAKIAEQINKNNERNKTIKQTDIYDAMYHRNMIGVNSKWY